MHLLNFTVVVLAITVKICWGGIIVKHSELNKSSQLAEVVVNIVECYYKNGGKGAGLVGKMAESFYRKLSEKLVPVTLLDGYSTKAYKDRFQRWELYKLNVFVLMASSLKKFDEIVRLTENSKWWDRTGHHLIVNWSSVKNDGCNDSAKYLLKAWEYNMINGRVVCQNHTERVMLYGYNPYTAKARESWKLERMYSEKMDHPFAVFSQVYRNKHEICETVGADITTNLAGHPFCSTPPLEVSDFKVSNWEMSKGGIVGFLTTQNVFPIMVSSLNATLVYPMSYTDGRQFRPNYVIEKCMDSFTREMSSAVLTDFGYRMFSYPIEKVEFLTVTQFRGHLTQLQKILGVTDVSSRMGLYLVLLLTLLFFKFFVRHSGMASFLNVLRVVCNTGFTNVPDGLSSRLYIGAVFLFAVVMQGIYQGNLAALLTQTMPIRDAMTKQDLVNMDYTIVGVADLVDMCFADTIFDDYVEAVYNFDECRRRMLKTPMTACLYPAMGAKDLASEFKLHLVGETMGSYYTSYALPLVTDLEERINMILLKIREADIIAPMSVRGLDRRISEFEFDEEVQKNQDYKVITLAELEFAFVILGIGLSCATIIFMIELAIARRPWTITTLIQFFNLSPLFCRLWEKQNLLSKLKKVKVKLLGEGVFHVAGRKKKVSRM